MPVADETQPRARPASGQGRDHACLLVLRTGRGAGGVSRASHAMSCQCFMKCRDRPHDSG
ncbi:hypothetical protein RAN3_0028 [plant metagenome]|uniref:Uncharacterized protein n=1 Tax=plant metagenome TaxID=1297885 RepID=A0A484PD49_9ZZZZ